MEFVCNNVWNAASYPFKSHPLTLVNRIRAKVKATPGEVLTFCYEKSQGVAKRATTTSPALLINKLYEPVRAKPITRVLKCMKAKIPLVENVWEKLHTTPEDWYTYLQSTFVPNNHPDVGLPPVELIKKYGYPVEVYKDIETEDGYLLEMYRIPHGKGYQDEVGKPVVLLMHGMMGSSADFVLTGPEKGLAYLLADRGYDVWLGNLRGNNYSRRHRIYDPNTDVDYWKFSFHEMGVYDLPAMIDLILKVTACRNLSYIGTSQGTTAFFVLTSEKPEYNKYIQVMIALAPVAYVTSISSPLVKLGIKIHGLVLPLATTVGVVEFPPRQLTPAITYLNKKGCNKRILQDAVLEVLYLICGYSKNQLKQDDISVILSNLPHPASVNQLYHFAQNAVADSFRKFDYGSDVNLQMYRMEKPPTYDLSRVASRVALYYSDCDYMAQPKDVLRLHSELPNSVCLHNVEDFNHIDFLYGADVVRVLYEHVFETLDTYTSS